jgi:hypothetical protein
MDCGGRVIGDTALAPPSPHDYAWRNSPAILSPPNENRSQNLHRFAPFRALSHLFALKNFYDFRGDPSHAQSHGTLRYLTPKIFIYRQ